MVDEVVTPLCATLEAAAREAGHVAQLGLSLQDSLSALLSASPGNVELQALDILAQQAEGLRSFLAALAVTCPATWRLDARAAAAGLLLGTQRKRLTLQPCTSDGPAPSGACELF